MLAALNLSLNNDSDSFPFSSQDLQCLALPVFCLGRGIKRDLSCPFFRLRRQILNSSLKYSQMSELRSYRFTSALVVTSLGLVLTQGGIAKPYLPSSESEVLEVLPNDFSKRRDDLTRLRERLGKDPENPALASAIGNEFIRMGGESGDPRFYGFARAAIAKWWPELDPPESILKIRAKLQERDHLYDLALQDLEKVTAKNATDAQAWLEIANIYRVQGRYDDARRACERLASFAGEVPVTLCAAPLDALTGKPEKAYQELARIVPKARQEFPGTVTWILTVQAEIARSLGRTEDAEALFKEGLQSTPNNQYLLRGYSDFLIDLRTVRKKPSLWPRITPAIPVSCYELPSRRVER